MSETGTQAPEASEQDEHKASEAPAPALVHHAADTVTTPDGQAHQIGTLLVPLPHEDSLLRALVGKAEHWTRLPHPHGGSWPRFSVGQDDQEFLTARESGRRAARRCVRRHHNGMRDAADWAEQLEIAALAVLTSALAGGITLEVTRAGVRSHPGHGCEMTGSGLRCDLAPAPATVVRPRPAKEK